MSVERRGEHHIDTNVEAIVCPKYVSDTGFAGRDERGRHDGTHFFERSAGAPEMEIRDRMGALAHHGKGNVTIDDEHAGVEESPPDTGLRHVFFDVRPLPEEEAEQAVDHLPVPIV